MMLSITFATVKIHIYYLIVVSFIADITYKRTLLEINELVGSGARRKSAVNIKDIWGHLGMKSENQMFTGSEFMTLYITFKLGRAHKFWNYEVIYFSGLVKPSWLCVH